MYEILILVTLRYNINIKIKNEFWFRILTQSWFELVQTRILIRPRPIQDWPESEIGLRHIYTKRKKRKNLLE
jgi:hypothetical protein